MQVAYAAPLQVKVGDNRTQTAIDCSNAQTSEDCGCSLLINFAKCEPIEQPVVVEYPTDVDSPRTHRVATATRSERARYWDRLRLSKCQAACRERGLWQVLPSAPRCVLHGATCLYWGYAQTKCGANVSTMVFIWFPSVAGPVATKLSCVID